MGKQSTKKVDGPPEKPFLTYANNPIWKDLHNLTTIYKALHPRALRINIVRSSVELIVHLLREYNLNSLSKLDRDVTLRNCIDLARKLLSDEESRLQRVRLDAKDYRLIIMNMMNEKWREACVHSVLGGCENDVCETECPLVDGDDARKALQTELDRPLSCLECDQLWFREKLTEVARYNSSPKEKKQRPPLAISWLKNFIQDGNSYIVYEPFAKTVGQDLHGRHDLRPARIKTDYAGQLSLLQRRLKLLVFRDYFNALIKVSLSNYWQERKNDPRTRHKDRTDLGLLYKCSYGRCRKLYLRKRRNGRYCSAPCRMAAAYARK